MYDLKLFSPYPADRDLASAFTRNEKREGDSVSSSSHFSCSANETYVSRAFSLIINEIKNAPSALLSHISTREFLRTREKCGEARAEDECFSHFPIVLKIPACLYNSTMHEEQVFYFFYKIKTSTKGQAVRQTTSLNSIGSKFG